MANNFDMFTKKGPSNTSENLPYAFSHIATGAPPSVYMSMMTGNTFDEAMQETNNIPMEPDEMEMDLDLDLALDPELDDPDAIEKAIYQLRIAEEKEIEPEEVVETPYGPGLSGEEIDLLLDAYPALDAGVDLDMIDENFDEVDRMLGESGESIEAAMDAAEQRAEDEGDIGASPAMMRQLGDNLGNSLEAMLNPRNRGEELAAETFTNPHVDAHAAVSAAAYNSANILSGRTSDRLNQLYGSELYSSEANNGVAQESRLMGNDMPTDDMLLGSGLEEEDPEAIISAADKQMTKEAALQEYQGQRQKYVGDEKTKQLLEIMFAPTDEGEFLTPDEIIAELERVRFYGTHTDGIPWAETIEEFLASDEPARDYYGLQLVGSFAAAAEGYVGGDINELIRKLEKYIDDERSGIAQSRREMVAETQPDPTPTQAAATRQFEAEADKRPKEEQIREWRAENPDLANFTDEQVLEQLEKEKILRRIPGIKAAVEREFREDNNISPNQTLTTEQREMIDEETKKRADELETVTQQQITERTGVQGKDDPYEGTELPEDIDPEDLVTENLTKTFYTTIYGYPESGRSDVRDRLPYIFSDTRTLFFLEHGSHAAKVLEELDLAVDEKERNKLLGSMEERYKSFLAEYLTDPSSKRTGEAFRQNLALVNETLDYAANNPNQELWSETFAETHLWVKNMFGSAGGDFAEKNRRNLIKMAATQGGRGYYSGLIHKAVDSAMDYYKRIGWTPEQIFKRMAAITGVPWIDSGNKAGETKVEREAKQIEEVTTATQAGQRPPGGADPIWDEEFIAQQTGLGDGEEDGTDLPGGTYQPPRVTPDVEVDMDPMAEDWEFQADPDAIADALAARGLSITDDKPADEILERVPVGELDFDPMDQLGELDFDPMDPRRNYTFAADPGSVEEAIRRRNTERIYGSMPRPELGDRIDEIQETRYPGLTRPYDVQPTPVPFTTPTEGMFFRGDEEPFADYQDYVARRREEEEKKAFARFLEDIDNTIDPGLRVSARPVPVPTSTFPKPPPLSPARVIRKGGWQDKP